MSTASSTRVRVNRDAVGQAAADLVNQGGLSSLSMSELASALEVKTPSLYAHVTGLDEVKRMLALRGLADLDDTIAHAALGKTASEAVRAVLFAYLEFVRANPGVYESLIPSPPADDAEWIAAADKLQSTTKAVLASFGFTTEEVIHVQRGLRSLAHGFAAFEASGAFTSPVDRDESFGWLVEVFLAGLEAKIGAGGSWKGSAGSGGAGTAKARTETSARAAGRKAAR